MPIFISGGRISNCGVGILSEGNADIRTEGLFIDNCGHAVVQREVSTSALVEEIRQRVLSDDRDELIRCVEAMTASTTKPQAMPFYERFMALAANHMTLLAPFFPAIEKILHGLS
jgi:hypothetical protein